jgi:hypothetical protein
MRRATLRLLTGTLLVLLLLGTTAQAGSSTTPVFLLDTDEQTYALIHRVDLRTGRLTTLGALPDVGPTVGLAAANAKRLFAVSWHGPLLEITLSPFRVEVVGDVGPNRIVGLAWADGVLYGSEEDSGLLWRIDPTTAAMELVGVIRLPDETPLTVLGGDLAEGPDGTWYLWTNSTMTVYRLDLATAVATPVPQQIFNNGQRTGLAFAYRERNFLLGSSADFDELVVTDPDSGAPTGFIPLCRRCPQRYDVAFGDLASPRCRDDDGDGYSPDGAGCGPIDCDDDDADRHPRAAETCNNVDDDCDGRVDEEPWASFSCDDGNPCTVFDRCRAGVCTPGTPRKCGFLNLLGGGECRPTDGACCGKVTTGFLRNLTICHR